MGVSQKEADTFWEFCYSFSMLTWKKALSSSVGRKYLMALTGLGLVGFMITHLAANLLLLAPSGTYLNLYAATLASDGKLLWVFEAGLAGLFLLHAVTAIRVTIANKGARPVNYASAKSKGAPSRSNLSSKYMAVSGVVLLVFLVLHIFHMKFGPAMPEGYVATIDGAQVRDLYRHAIEQFQIPWVVALYTAVMIFLAFHVRHGFWSAFQSLGLAFPKYSRAIHGLGIFIALSFGLGFVSIPIAIYLGFAGGEIS